MANIVERVSFDLPADIIFDVLLRLPVKTLIRFKSVCKTWCALIENPNFVEIHQKMQPSIKLEPTYNNIIVTANGPRNTKKCSLLHFSDASQKLIDTELSYLSCMEDCVVVGVCNGLVCLGLSFNSTELIIFNPTTRQLRQTPKFKISKLEYDLIFMGFHLNANGYEIIRIVYTRTCGSIPIIRGELYTMCFDTWRVTEVKLGYNLWLGELDEREQDYPEAVIIDGVFYWKAKCSPYDLYVSFFDIRTGVFDVIETPREVVVSMGCQLHGIKEQLALIIYNDYNKSQLWVLNEDLNWTMIHKIDFSSTLSYPVNRGDKIRVLGSTGNGDLVLVNHYEDNLRLFLFDLNSQEIKCLYDVNSEGVIEEFYLYTESLTPVN